MRALNDLRKDLGFAIADRVVATITVGDGLQAALDEHRSWIAGEILATALDDGPGDRRLEVDGSAVAVTLTLA